MGLVNMCFIDKLFVLKFIKRLDQNFSVVKTLKNLAKIEITAFLCQLLLKNPRNASLVKRMDRFELLRMSLRRA